MKFELLTCFACRRSASLKQSGKEVCLSCSYVPGLTGSNVPLDEWEKAALPIAGDAAGALLDGWGKTNLAELSEAQWIEFLKCVVVSFGDAVRAQQRSGKAPF